MRKNGDRVFDDFSTMWLLRSWFNEIFFIQWISRFYSVCQDTNMRVLFQKALFSVISIAIGVNLRSILATFCFSLTLHFTSRHKKRQRRVFEALLLFPFPILTSRIQYQKLEINPTFSHLVAKCDWSSSPNWATSYRPCRSLLKHRLFLPK